MFTIVAYSICTNPCNTRQVCMYCCYSETSMMRGHIYSECFTPMVNDGGLLYVMLVRSGLCAPGPGFLVLSGISGGPELCMYA